MFVPEEGMRGGRHGGLNRGGAAIVGVAESDLGDVAEGLCVIDLMGQAWRGRSMTAG